MPEWPKGYVEPECNPVIRLPKSPLISIITVIGKSLIIVACTHLYYDSNLEVPLSEQMEVVKHPESLLPEIKTNKAMSKETQKCTVVHISTYGVTTYKVEIRVEDLYKDRTTLENHLCECLKLTRSSSDQLEIVYYSEEEFQIIPPISKEEALYHSVSGYYKDNPEDTFEGYIVKATHDILEEEDDSIFFYGLDKNALEQALNNTNTIHDFVITGFEQTTL